jgi:hypothetical protein
MKVLKTMTSIALTCLIACAAYTTAAAQGRARSVGGNPNAGRGANRGVSNGRGRTADVNNGQDRDEDTGGNQHGAMGNHKNGRPGSDDDDSQDRSGGLGAGRRNSGIGNIGLGRVNHGQMVSRRRRAAIEAWKATGRNGPPPWAGVGGGPGGNPNQPGLGQQIGRVYGGGRVRRVGKRHGNGHGRGRVLLPGVGTIGLP